MRGVFILGGLNLLLWGLFLASGVSAMASVAGQNTPGYPSAEQTAWYVGAPALALLLCALQLGLAAARVPVVGRGAWQAPLTLALVPYLFLYGG